MASNHQPGAPSLEFSNDSDSDCYIVDSGSEVEIQFDTEPESVDSFPIDLGSDDEMFEVSEFEYERISESSTGEVTETVSDKSDDDNMDAVMMTSMTLVQMFQTGLSGARLFSLRGFWK